ncbi:hypothetical protein ACTXT7_009350 [Hymenolepis weldensis]
MCIFIFLDVLNITLSDFHIAYCLIPLSLIELYLADFGCSSAMKITKFPNLFQDLDSAAQLAYDGKAKRKKFLPSRETCPVACHNWGSHHYRKPSCDPWTCQSGRRKFCPAD